MRRYAVFIAVLFIGILSLGQFPVTSAQSAPFQLKSTVLEEGGTVKTEHVANSFGCSGGNLSPDLSWSGVPEGTQSFGLSLFDADAPTGSGFWHWVMFNIPADATSLAAGAGDPSKTLAPAGSIQIRNDAGIPGYVGPCPPAGDKPHRYVLTLFALKLDKLPLDQTASGALAGFYFNGNLLGKATLTVTYGH